MTPEQRRSYVIACGEAAVDEIFHLPPDMAGEALSWAITWQAIALERDKGDAAALAFYANIRKQIDEAEQKLRGFMAKPILPEPVT